MILPTLQRLLASGQYGPIRVAAGPRQQRHGKPLAASQSVSRGLIHSKRLHAAVLWTHSIILRTALWLGLHAHCNLMIALLHCHMKDPTLGTPCRSLATLLSWGIHKTAAPSVNTAATQPLSLPRGIHSSDS